MKELTVPTKREVIDWLKTLPQDRQFNYYDNAHCLFAAYASEALGYSNVNCDGPFVSSNAVDVLSIPKQLRAPIIDIAWPPDQSRRKFTAKEAIAALEKEYEEEYA